MEKVIKIDEDLWKKLHNEKIEEGFKTISDLVRTKIDFTEKFLNEREFSKWFENNYELLGFTKIITKRVNKFPDFRMELKGKEIEIELETLSSNFIRHKHNPDKCDLVICILKDIELPVKTIEIPNFIYNKSKIILLEENIWRTLQELKLKHGYKSLSEVITGLLVRQNKRNVDNEPTPTNL